MLHGFRIETRHPWRTDHDCGRFERVRTLAVFEARLDALCRRSHDDRELATHFGEDDLEDCLTLAFGESYRFARNAKSGKPVDAGADVEPDETTQAFNVQRAVG